MPSEKPHSFAFAGDLRDRVVRLAPGVPCPYCGREFQAHDYQIRDEDRFLICQGCHRDFLTETSS